MNILILFENKAFTMNILRCLGDAGVRCFVLGAGEAWDVRLSRYCHRYIKCQGTSFWNCSPDLVEKINKYCIRHRISCIIPADYQTTLFLSKVAHQLNPQIKTIPLGEPQTLQILDNKWEFSKLLKAHNIPQPETFLAENMEQFKSMPLSFPCAVKPIQGGGRWTGGRIPGSYIKKDRTEYLSSAQQGFPLLVQEFIPGIDVGLNLFAVQGKIVAWTMQEFVGHDRLKFFQSQKLLELGERIVAVSNFQGAANIDIRLDQRDGQFKVIECNPRFWGSLRASKWNGTNFPVLAINAALGRVSAEKTVYKNIEYVFPSRVLSKLFKGNISALRGLPEATRKDLCQILGDPISCLYSVFERR